MISKRLVQEAVRARYGEALAKIERWSTFRNGETTEEWIRFLGQTAIVLTHQEMEVVEHLLRDDTTVSDADKARLALAYAFHDIGEIVVDDLPNPEKTPESDMAEWRAAIPLLSAIARDIGVGNELVDTYMDIVAGDDAKLHHLFKAIERTEYFMTGIHGYLALVDDNDASPNKWMLVTRVLAFDLPRIIEYAKAYPESIGKFLFEQQHNISAMLAKCSPVVTPDFSDQYRQAVRDWNVFRAQAVLR